MHSSMAAAAMTSLLKASSYNNYTNQTNLSINRRITPPSATRISFPINRRLIIPTITLTQTPLPKITTAITKCCSSSINRGSTLREEKEDTKKEEVPFSFEIMREVIVNKMLEVVKGLEKPALTAILVWVLLTNNPTIASSYSSRTAFFWGVWFVYDVCKAIATTRRIGDDASSSIRFSLGNVLGSTMVFLLGSIALLFAVIMVVLIAVVIGIVLFICGLMAMLMLVLVMFWGMLVGFGKVTWPPSETDEGISVNTNDEQKKKKSTN